MEFPDVCIPINPNDIALRTHNPRKYASFVPTHPSSPNVIHGSDLLELNVDISGRCATRERRCEGCILSALREGSFDALCKRHQLKDLSATKPGVVNVRSHRPFEMLIVAPWSAAVIVNWTFPDVPVVVVGFPWQNSIVPAIPPQMASCATFTVWKSSVLACKSVHVCSAF